jgi:hypothetical protein
MGDSDVIAAKYGPGFSHDLTEWQVFVGRNRWLRQKVVVWNQDSEFHKRVLWFWAKLSRRDMAGLWEIVERIGFQEFRRSYTHQTMCVTDCPSYWITVRFPDRVKEVEAYDLRRLSEFERQPDMIGFQELWEVITAHAPYGKVPTAEGLPRPSWRFWK